MTILNVLKHHGYNVERRVTPSGRIVFSAASATPSAVGMPMKRHTFHGGTSPVEHVAAALPWWTNEESVARDRDAMAQFFPGFAELGGSDGRPPAWVGAIDTGYGKFTITVQHRVDHGLPHVIPGRPKTGRLGRHSVASPHTFMNGNLCVAAQDDWDPKTDTIATVVGWAAHWHAAYVEWLFTGTWPMEGYVHHEAA